MNSTLPAPRDLPSRSRARIRAELQRAYGQRRRMRYVPVIGGVAAVVVVAVVVVLAPWSSGNSGNTMPPAATIPATTSTPPGPVFPGLAVQDQRDIEAGCALAAGKGTAQLRNLQTDEAGRFALLYTESVVLSCTLGRRGLAYDSGTAGISARHWLPGEFAVDQETATTGGSSSSAGPDRRGEPGEIRAEGRISSKVARVTFTVDDRTVDAALANGTFLVRVLYPATWQLPENYRAGIVRAYDADGKLLGEYPNPNRPCYRIPENGLLNLGPVNQQPPVDPWTCPVATRWD